MSKVRNSMSSWVRRRFFKVQSIFFLKYRFFRFLLVDHYSRISCLS